MFQRKSDQENDADGVIIIATRFDHSNGDYFYGGLELNEADYHVTRMRYDCPDENTYAYYKFLRDEAGAMPCSPDDDRHQPAMIKRDKKHNILATYLYGVNADGVIGLCSANERQVKEQFKISATFYMSAWFWRACHGNGTKLLNAPPTP